MFLAGNVWSVILPNALALAGDGGVLPRRHPAQARASVWNSAAMLQRILALMIKEFLALLKDKRSRVVVSCRPIIQLLVFGYAATFDLNRIPFARLQRGPRRGVARPGGALPRRRPIPAGGGDLHAEREIAPLVDGKQVLMVLHIGPRFTRELLGGVRAPVQVIVDGRNSNTAPILLNYVSTIVDELQPAVGAAPRAARPARHARNARVVQPEPGEPLVHRPRHRRLLTLVVTTLVTALSVAREREQGTFDQLLVTPLRPGEILLGKALPGFIIGFVEATVIILLATLWFKVPLRGSLPRCTWGSALFLLSAVGMGLMISSLAVTQQQGLLGAFLFLVPSIILSGFATPIANMPQAVQHVTSSTRCAISWSSCAACFWRGSRSPSWRINCGRWH